MKWMAFQKDISVDISHTSVAESIKLDAMGTCDVCDMYVRMYVCSYHVITLSFCLSFLIFLCYSLSLTDNYTYYALAHVKLHVHTYVHTCMDKYEYEIRCIM